MKTKDMQQLSATETSQKFGIITGFFFTVNNAIGSGLLGVPFAFRMSG